MMPQQHLAAWDMPQNLGPPNMSMPHYAPGPPAPAKKFYTFQRVNGNGGNGKGDGIAGPHKHSLEESDRVKKNSVLRWQAKVGKDDRKKIQVSLSFLAVPTACLNLASFMSVFSKLRFHAT